MSDFENLNQFPEDSEPEASPDEILSDPPAEPVEPSEATEPTEATESGETTENITEESEAICAVTETVTEGEASSEETPAEPPKTLYRWTYAEEASRSTTRRSMIP